MAFINLALSVMSLGLALGKWGETTTTKFNIMPVLVNLILAILWSIAIYLDLNKG